MKRRVIKAQDNPYMQFKITAFYYRKEKETNLLV